jgi:2-polyprenyl-6-methoxyphenol hydroxylase-like FAD-dependent oxidoreductase
MADLAATFSEYEWLLPAVFERLSVDDVWHGDSYRVSADPWVDGRVALLGDAAHAMHPVSGMGAALAMEDAYVLADELAEREDAIEARLRDYVGRRRSRVRKLQRSARLSTRFVFTESKLLTLARDALALRSNLLENLFVKQNRARSEDLLERL